MAAGRRRSGAGGADVVGAAAPRGRNGGGKPLQSVWDGKFDHSNMLSRVIRNAMWRRSRCSACQQGRCLARVDIRRRKGKKRGGRRATAARKSRAGGERRVQRAIWPIA